MAEIIAGRVALVPKGEFNINTSYLKLDIVTYEDSSYICRKNCSKVNPSNTEYWQLLAKSSSGSGEGLPTISVEVDFWENGDMNREHLKLHNWEYYIQNGYKLAVLRKGRYKCADLNAEERNGMDEHFYKKMNHYGWKMTVTNPNGDPFWDDETNAMSTNWKMHFLTVDENGIVKFVEEGINRKVIADHLVHKKVNEDGDYCIASPRGSFTLGSNSAVQLYGLAFVDPTKYKPWCGSIKDKDCISNIASFRVFVDPIDGNSHFKK